ncbi:MAG: aspartate--tRNA ligase [Clostridia bacterium]|nr:aspartate--tRNA ligase [Clostridia bacterium]
MIMRTHNCGELRDSNVGEKVKLCGWLSSIRDLGAVIFFVLRDFYGYMQVVVADEDKKAQIRAIPRESTVSVEGTVVLRSAPNPEMPTGLIEIEPETIEVLGKCYEQLPFEVATSTQSREDVRLKYRFLDLRNPEVKDKIVFRSKVVSWLRNKMTELGFLEITTPILTSSSPEGARDYIVPSRLYPGHFYALPQAPQQYKQLLMASGFDKYFQIAPCFRDEDARADRSPGEFYQLDTEMCFATQEDVFAVMEQVLSGVFKEFSPKGYKVDEGPFRRIAYRDAMRDYGSDKPDLRNPLLVKDVTDILVGKAPFFEEGKTVKAIAVNGFTETRKWIDALTEKAKQNGASNMYWFKLDENGAPVGGISKFVVEVVDKLKERLDLQAGGFVAILAEEKGVEKQAGYVRTELGVGLDLIEKNAFRFCWIVDFPMYEYDDDGNLGFCHNPFSMPQGGLEALNTKNPIDILAYQYDSVVNGVELSSGAVRNHEPAIMERAFEIVGYGKEVIEEKFSALYNAFKFGAPPHAGIAPGVDRMVMLLCGEQSIREIITFPMDRNARDILMGAPSTVTQKQLDDVHIKIVAPNVTPDGTQNHC